MMGALGGGAAMDRLKDQVELARLISSKKDFDKRLKELEATTEKAQKVLALVGPAEQILEMRRLMDNELETAKAIAARVRKDADEYAAKVKAAAAAEARDAADDAARILDEVAAQRKEAEDLRRELEKWEKRLDKRGKEIAADHRMANEVKTKYANKLAQLRAVAVD